MLSRKARICNFFVLHTKLRVICSILLISCITTRCACCCQCACASAERLLHARGALRFSPQGPGEGKRWPPVGFLCAVSWTLVSALWHRASGLVALPCQRDALCQKARTLRRRGRLVLFSALQLEVSPRVVMHWPRFAGLMGRADRDPGCIASITDSRSHRSRCIHSKEHTLGSLFTRRQAQSPLALPIEPTLRGFSISESTTTASLLPLPSPLRELQAGGPPGLQPPTAPLPNLLICFKRTTGDCALRNTEPAPYISIQTHCRARADSEGGRGCPLGCSGGHKVAVAMGCALAAVLQARGPRSRQFARFRSLPPVLPVRGIPLYSS